VIPTPYNPGALQTNISLRSELHAGKFFSNKLSSMSVSTLPIKMSYDRAFQHDPQTALKQDNHREHLNTAQFHERQINDPGARTKSNTESGMEKKKELRVFSCAFSPRAGDDPAKDSKSPISTLPPEIILDIIKLLKSVQTVCFGLTNKRHYILNKYMNRHPIDLGEIIGVRDEVEFLQRPIWQPIFLYRAIGEFMNRGGWEYSHQRCLFIKKGKELGN
jgi:hypothetical protein